MISLKTYYILIRVSYFQHKIDQIHIKYFLIRLKRVLLLFFFFIKYFQFGIMWTISYGYKVVEDPLEYTQIVQKTKTCWQHDEDELWGPSPPGLAGPLGPSAAVVPRDLTNARVHVRRNASVVSSLYVCQARLSNVIVGRYQTAATATATITRWTTLTKLVVHSRGNKKIRAKYYDSFVLIIASGIAILPCARLIIREMSVREYKYSLSLSLFFHFFQGHLDFIQSIKKRMSEPVIEVCMRRSRVEISPRRGQWKRAKMISSFSPLVKAQSI